MDVSSCELRHRMTVINKIMSSLSPADEVIKDDGTKLCVDMKTSITIYGQIYFGPI